MNYVKPRHVALTALQTEVGSGSTHSTSDTHGQDPAPGNVTHGLGHTPEYDPHGLSTHQSCLNHMGQSAQQPYVAFDGPAIAQPPYGVLSDDEVLQVIRKHVLMGPVAKPWKKLFAIRRDLGPIALERGWQLSDWKAVVERWLSESNVNGAALDFDKVWPEFEKKLAVVVDTPVGSVLASVEARIPYVIVPAQLGHPKLDAVARTMIALSEENARRGRPKFYASLREIARLAGLNDHKAACRRLQDLYELGYLGLIEVGRSGIGRTGKANTWQWHATPCPGKAVWNDSKELAGSSEPGSSSEFVCSQPLAPTDTPPSAASTTSDDWNSW